MSGWFFYVTLARSSHLDYWLAEARWCLLDC